MVSCFRQLWNGLQTEWVAGKHFSLATFVFRQVPQDPPGVRFPFDFVLVFDWFVHVGLSLIGQLFAKAKSSRPRNRTAFDDCFHCQVVANWGDWGPHFIQLGSGNLRLDISMIDEWNWNWHLDANCHCIHRWNRTKSKLKISIVSRLDHRWIQLT